MINTYVVAFLCVVGLAIGQILFKFSASALAKGSSVFHFKVLGTLLVAMCLYALTSIAWVWVLRKIELGRIYPLMALAFVFVPIGSYFIFGEGFNWQYAFGVILIIVGIIFAVTA